MDLERINELGFEKSSKWQTIVMVVSFSKWWNIFIGLQCYAIFVIATFCVSNKVSVPKLEILRFLMDVCYVFEIVCTVTYRLNPKIRKLKYVNTRGWFFIFIDILSVIPFELIYTFHYMSDHKNITIHSLFTQNRLLRIYRIFLLESFYETVARKPFQYAVLVFFQYTYKLFLVAHVMNCVWEIVEKSVPCNPKQFKCIVWTEINMLDLVMLNWSGKVESFRKPWERVIVTGGMLISFFIVFSHFYPNLFYISMQLYYKRAVYYRDLQKLQAFFKNMVHNAKLKSKIQHHFNDVWSKGQADSNFNHLLKNIPLALRKEFSTDIYWESLRHSGLFRDVSRNCKRSLSLLMSTEYYNSGEVVYYEGQNKLRMIFISQGILQVMAEENEESAVLSFSTGTVFGEVSLFFFLRSRAILKCLSHCELQVLTVNAATAVLRDYPKDKKRVFHNLHQRLLMAKYTQWRKHKFKDEVNMDNLSLENPSDEDCVKWLKAQWKALWEIHNRHQKVIKAKEEGTRLQSWHRIAKTEIRIEYVSNDLDLVVLSDVLEEKKDVVCFRTTFPWSIDPSTQFLHIWYYVVLLASLVPALLYPACTAWTTHFPRSVYQLSFVVTLIFMIDLILKLFTAVKTKHSIITQFSAVLRHSLQRPTFYLDIIAALPYQIIVFFTRDVDTANSYDIGLFLHPTLLKSYVLITLKVPLGIFVDKITVFKNCLIYFLLLYWFAEIIQLICVRDLVDVSQKWIIRFMEHKKKDEAVSKYYVSVFSVLVTAMSIPDYLMHPDATVVLIFFTFAKYFFFLFMGYFLNELYGVITVKIYDSETFQVLIRRIANFLENIYISEQITDRLLKSLKFQWNYDRADYLSSEISIVKAIPFNLRKLVYSETTYESLLLCPLFQEESYDLILDVLEKSFLVAVPRGSVLVTYGHTSHLISVLHRGYCQMNSFLSNDVSSEIGRSIRIGPGTIFPLLSSIASIPSPVSVVTVTDCEVIMIHLDDLLNIMFRYKFFKDVFEVMKTLNVEERLVKVKPGLMKVNLNSPPGEIEKTIFKEAFEHKGFHWKFLYLCCPKKNIFSMKFFQIWDLIYTLYTIIVCWLWPCCFGLFLMSSHIIVPILTATKGFGVLHLIFRFYLGYFNKTGLFITHPVYTFLNYLTSTFIIDVIRIFPIYQIYLYGFADPYKKPHISAVLFIFFQLFLKMSFMMGFLNNLQHFFKSKYLIRMSKTIIGILLLFNLFVNLIMYLYLKWIFGGPYHVVAFEAKPGYFPNNSTLLTNNCLWDYYIFTAYWMLCCLTTTDYLLHEPSGDQLYLSYFQGFIGTMGTFFLYVWVSSNSIFSNIRGTIYQEEVFSFINYLHYEKADDSLIEYAKSYYNYEWSQTHGESLKMLCEHLPTHLHEELVYPIYRSTISRNQLFANADEGFFKVLATQVKSVFFNRGSVILFQNEVQSDIFFVHKGKCFVYDWFLVLDNGSIVGDIQRTGLMQNKVYALTHVEMLKISSEEFFNILTNFYNLEATFLYRVKNAENFVCSDIMRTGQQLRPVDSKDVLKAFCLKKKEVSFEDESIFEDPENSSIHVLKALKFKRRKKHGGWIIYPGTWKMKVYTAMRVTVTVVTLISLPIFMSFGGLTITAFVVIGATDFFWLVIISFTFRVGITDKQKGDVITDFKIIVKSYAKRLNGLVIDVVSLIPFELIPVTIARGIKSANGKHVAWARMFRLFRGHCFYQFLKGEAETLENKIYLKYFYVTSFFIVLLLLSVAIYVEIATEPSIVAARTPFELGREQFFAFVLAFEYVINFVSSANICVIIPDTKMQLHFFNFFSVIFVFLKSVLISKTLSLLYVNGLAKAYYKSEVLALESYLSEKDTSPSIIKEVLTYRTNLLFLCRSENMPTLMRKAPATIRIMVMRDIYIQHLINCPLFENIEKIFLDQLIARASREFYFPGQKIVEQGDVDRRLYFIHRGEVYIISQTKDKAYIEHIVRIIKAGESFGEPQGLWFSVPHSFTYRARTLVEIVVIHSDDWIDLRRNFPDIAKKIYDKAKSLRYI